MNNLTPITQTANTPAANSSDARNGQPRPPVSGRAVAIGLSGAMLLCAITPFNNYLIGATYLAGNQMPIGPMFALLLFIGVINPLLHKIAPRKVFQRGELLTIWALMLVASGLPCTGLMSFLLPHIAAPMYFSNGANNWESRVWGKLPAGLGLSDRAAAKAYFTGYPRGAEHIPWEAWARPLAVWGILAACFFVATFCLANLMRRQWVDNEKFVFPLVSLPLMLTEDPGAGTRLPPLLRRPNLWAAVALTTALHTLNGMRQLYPGLPFIPTSVNVTPFLTAPPWDQIGLFPVLFFALVVGLTYLLPTDIAFSFWFFFLFYKAQILVGVSYGWDMPPSLGSPAERQFSALQGFGAALGLFGWTLWTARAHLRNVWQKALKPRASAIDDSREMLPYRATVVGLALSYIGMALWLHYATVSWPVIALSLLLLTMSLVTVSWVVTQAGTFYMIMPCMAVDVLGTTVGTHVAAPGAWYSLQRVECMFYRDTRDQLLPEVLSGAKTADVGGFSLRSLLLAMSLAVILGLGVALAASLAVPYYNGGANLLFGNWTFRSGPVRPIQMAAKLGDAPILGKGVGMLHIAVGTVGTIALLLLRARTGVGLHPLGFISASVESGRTLWLSVMIGWMCKTLVLRFGGMRGYRSALPFFMGLILGDALNAAIWTVVGALTGIGYNLLPQ